jgi:hypothetical protein
MIIYSKNEKAAYEKDADVDLSECRGYAADNLIYCNGEIPVCFHEAVHFTDWLLGTHLNIEQGTLWSNTELRAYLVEYIGGEIMKYCVMEGK